MTLTRITITGADDGVSHADLALLSREFPFVEWGILFSVKRAGEPRYPSAGWLDTFCAVARLEPSDSPRRMKASAHFCGQVARDTLGGSRFWIDRLPMVFGAVQLNGFTESTDALVSMLSAHGGTAFEWILQVRDPESMLEAGEVAGRLYRTDTVITMLWDASGGRGLTETHWPEPMAEEAAFIPLGNAGGINPDNIEEHCKRLAARDDVIQWLDFETGARTDDKFDIEKCRRALEIAKPYVKEY